jgi:ABC-2 type transport system ATP-binding protein
MSDPALFTIPTMRGLQRSARASDQQSPDPIGDAVLIVRDLTKRYNGRAAVDGISFEVAAGETFGILGPNGAGKTTTLEMIEGLRRPDGGSITLMGLDAVRERRRVQQRIGVQLQSQAIWPELTVEETLRVFGALFHRRLPVADLLRRFSLEGKRSARVKDLSGGQKQRLSVAVALVNDPDIVFLDEPTTGLDPQARHALWDLAAGMKVDGKTVILTTHNMEEAETLCDRIAIMDHGRIIALDTPRRLVRALDFENIVECSFQRPIDSAALEGLPAVRGVTHEDESYLLFTSHVSVTLAGLMRLAESHGYHLESLHVRTATLEDVFISLTGRRLRD